MDNDIDRDILNNAKYIIQYFNAYGAEVTNLKLEKLLYFLEAIYMVATNDDNLFLDDFTAWNFGPVSIKVYNQYRKFGNLPIELDNNIGIPATNLPYITKLYDLFKDYSVLDLVSLSHMSDSPWFKINEQYFEKIPHNIIINKHETREWFRSIIVESE